ncbi:MAG TPA: phosphatase PAP2 family protein [Armatimonadota bacterium]|nr:phosphatase PAP2 family protein [Armatimonadota bacterium]
MWSWGLEFLVWLEHFRSPITNALAMGASALGSEPAYLAVLAVIYLCIDHRFGFRVMVMFLIGAHANTLIKTIYHTPRPYVLHPGLNPIWPESGGGHSFPSGHAQNATVVWGLIATHLKSWWWRIAAILLIAAIAISRPFLQLHWPIDIIGGALIGCVLIGAYFGVAHLTRSWSPAAWHQALIVVTASAAMLAVAGNESHCARPAGALLGAGLGYILLQRKGYSAKAPLAIQVVKAVVALAVLAGLRIACEFMLGSSIMAQAAAYAVVGFMVTCGLPLVFLATIEHARAEPGEPAEA